ncbi:flavodoxin domain-containing protein [Thalassococcus sp. S3]|uniref:flavodoxin domain-containing protein n=1 Tax=Thalassococcus sp. S3 TaxID=2017482 RepID=UPI001023F73F|nr:flavodoxin domain-containing protein [Thalassococcus sp. S3]QBF33432.1 nitric oxide synthase [Thalassococcus sp. S3]
MILVLYGTETGNAEMVAEDTGDAIDASYIVNLSDITPSDLDPGALHLFVCSTYGEGELPASAKEFAAALAQDQKLGGVPFAIFGLGDRSYETFAGGAKSLRALLLSCGAVEIAPIMLHDANGPELPEDAAIAWAQAALARAAAA